MAGGVGAEGGGEEAGVVGAEGVLDEGEGFGARYEVGQGVQDGSAFVGGASVVDAGEVGGGGVGGLEDEDAGGVGVRGPQRRAASARCNSVVGVMPWAASASTRSSQSRAGGVRWGRRSSGRGLVLTGAGVLGAEWVMRWSLPWGRRARVR